MTNFSNSNHKEHPSTYFVQDRSSKEELQRLQIQDHLLTTTMGGVLPEQPDTIQFKRVLDIGCGPGGWLIDMAREYPDCEVLIGVDASKQIVEYARKQAYDAQQDHIEFHVMDALRMLEFPDAFFDLVNLRCGSSYVRIWDWPKLLEEMRRVCRSGGLLRLTEPEMVTESSSTALPLFCMHIQQAMYKAGHLFENAPNGITAHLPRLLHQHGGMRIQVQTRAYSLVFRAGTPEGQAFAQDVIHGVRTLKEFVTKWCGPSPDYDTLSEQVLQDLEQPDFSATWKLLTAWAVRDEGVQINHA
jgi:ubiquinone/menaquinone biosynthesis C-methylase UbiE